MNRRNGCPPHKLLSPKASHPSVDKAPHVQHMSRETKLSSAANHMFFPPSCPPRLPPNLKQSLAVRSLSPEPAQVSFICIVKNALSPKH